ncbi:MAG: protein kinase family protein [Gammaproteobacteria bacterium]|nr:protein kinase family protein [Gammaproteobacteria bacterium]
MAKINTEVARPCNKLNGTKVSYQREGLLGRGNFGTVYLYVSENGNAYKAVKFYQKNYHIQEEYDGYKTYYPDEEFFLQQQSQSYLIMPFFDGILLEKAKGNLNAWLKAAEAIHLLHKKGLIHGDLKTDNIIYNAKNNCCYLIDFGFCYKVNGNAITVSRFLRANSVKRLWAPERYTVYSETVAANKNQDVYTFCKLMFDRRACWQYEDYEDIDCDDDGYGRQYEAQELLLYNCLRSTLMMQDAKDRPPLKNIIKLIGTTIKAQKEMERNIKDRNSRIELDNNNQNNSQRIGLLLRAANQVNDKSPPTPIVEQPIHNPFNMLLLAIKMDEKKNTTIMQDNGKNSKNRIVLNKKSDGVKNGHINSTAMLFSVNSNKRKRRFNDDEMASPKSLPAEKKRKINNGNSVIPVNNSING